MLTTVWMLGFVCPLIELPVLVAVYVGDCRCDGWHLLKNCDTPCDHLSISLPQNTTSIFSFSSPLFISYQSLHLGHLAKCFGLRESPKTLRVHDDNISKIFNGLYSAALFNDKEAKKKARDEKFSLSKGVKKAAQAAKPPQTGGNKWRGGATDNNAQKSITSSGGGDEDNEVVGISSSAKAVASTQLAVSATSKPIPIIIPSDKRKMRIGAGSGRTGAGVGGSSKLLAPSGKFRKSAEGYFKKKLRTQSSSEFSA